MTYDDYAEALDTEGRAWMPKEAEDNDHPLKLIGTLVARGTRTTQYGEYPILTIKDEHDEVWTWHAFGTVAIREVEQADPTEGDVVGVKYRGVSDKAKPGQSPAALWTVKVFERKATPEAAF